jgi:hypothetical protein
LAVVAPSPRRTGSPSDAVFRTTWSFGTRWAARSWCIRCSSRFPRSCRERQAVWAGGRR